MDDTPNLGLPYILAAQAQKHVTHNEAIRALDCVVQLAVATRTLGAPPTSPADGARYIVATGASGAWAGNVNAIAAWQDGTWEFYPPHAGWMAWVADEARLYVFDGTGWSLYQSTALNPAPMVGVNATADTTNRLAVKSPAVLLDNVGNGIQAKLNKNAATDTASTLYQTGYSGRAEIGLTGDDNFHFKVSADGSTWTEAIVIDRTSGAVSMPHTAGMTQVNADWNATSGVAQVLNKPTLGTAAAQNATAFDAAGAAAAAQAAAVQRANHTGTQAASTITGLATVATTGAYSDLSGKPTLGTAAAQNATAFDAAGAAAAAQAAAVQRANHTGTQAASTITGLATVATTGAYSDLSGKPTIPTVPGAFGASGSGHASGLVPDPGATAGTAKFLREDSTWATPAGGGGSGDAAFGTAQNMSLAASVASNALTIALKDKSGNDPSSGSAVVIPFRSSTLTDGKRYDRTVTGALSVVVPSAQAMGTANGSACRLWVVAIDNAGTVELAVINCLTGGVNTASAITSITEDLLISTTAIAAAPNAGTYYSTTARSNVACRILGYVEFASGQATAGTWATAPSKIQHFGPGVKRPGEAVQMKYVSNGVATTVTSNTKTATTIAAAIAPTSAANPIRVDAAGPAVIAGTAAGGLGQIGRNSSANMIGTLATWFVGLAGNSYVPGYLQALDKPNTTSATTYTVYIFLDSASGSTFTMPAAADGDIGTMMLTEYMA